MGSDSNLIKTTTRKVLLLHGQKINKVKKLAKTVKRYLKLEKLTKRDKCEIKRQFDDYKSNSKLIKISSTVGNSKEPRPTDISATNVTSLKAVQSMIKCVPSEQVLSSEILVKDPDPSLAYTKPHSEVEIVLEPALGVGDGDIKEQELGGSHKLLIEEGPKYILGTPGQRQRLNQKMHTIGQELQQEEARSPLVKEVQIKSIKPSSNYPSHKAPPSKPPSVDNSLTDLPPQRVQRKPPKRHSQARKTQLLNKRSRSSSNSKKRKCDQGSHQNFRPTKRAKKDYPGSLPRNRSRSLYEQRDHRNRPQSRSDYRQRRKHTYKNPNDLNEDRPRLKTKKDITGDRRGELIRTVKEESNILPWRHDNYISRSVSPQQPGQNFSKLSGQRPLKEIVPESNKPSISGGCETLSSGEPQNLVHSFSPRQKDRDMTARKEILRYAIDSFVHRFESNIPSLQLQKKYLASLCSDEFLRSLHTLNDLLRKHSIWKLTDQANFSDEPQKREGEL